uniref:Putative RNA-directed DNA polymerase n=1 Tax=Schizaphis graminum TaxID=13262 RepID=A0A2S2PDH6_SCHGA
MLLKLMWVYGIQLWGSAKPTNINRIQAYQSKTLRQIIKAPYYVSNHDLSIPFVADVAKTHYKRLHNSLLNHRNPLMHVICSLTFPGNPSKQLKCKWCRNLLID